MYNSEFLKWCRNMELLLFLLGCVDGLVNFNGWCLVLRNRSKWMFILICWVGEMFMVGDDVIVIVLGVKGN